MQGFDGVTPNLKLYLKPLLFGVGLISSGEKIVLIVSLRRGVEDGVQKLCFQLFFKTPNTVIVTYL